MRLLLITFFALFILQQCLADLNSEWKKFKLKYKKVYSTSEEEAFRKKMFAVTLKKIEKHHAKYKARTVSFDIGINQFADMTDKEYTRKLQGILEDKVEGTALSQNFTRKYANVPDYVNWVEYGYNLPVLDQGGCDCSYAFAAVAALEGQFYVKHRMLIELSQQELLDCSKEYGNFGCGGGTLQNTYSYIFAFDIGDAKPKPYTGKEFYCTRNQPRTKIGEIYRIVYGEEESLKTAVATVGPISIGVDASLDSFKRYKVGVYYDERCNPGRLNHQMAIVGYGHEGGLDYWLIKNSWGTDWGLNGYIKMARNRNNHCGVASGALYAIVV